MKAILIKTLASITTDKKSRSKLIVAVLSVATGLIFLMVMPFIVLSSISGVENPATAYEIDEAEFISQLSPEQQEMLSRIETDGQAIAGSLSAIGLQEQTIKAQLIYMSYFEDNRLTDFTDFANMFTQDDEQLIQSLNSYYGLDIDYDEFMRTYIMVMNATINGYMFTDTAEKNSDDLAAWCRNAYISGWGYADNSFGERDAESRIRCADNVGLIMGYIRYDTESRAFSSDRVDLYYTEIGSIDTMPDVHGVGVLNGTSFGVYVGGGDVIFSSAMGGCVQRTPLADGNWTAWCTFDDICYPQEVTDCISEIRNPTQSATE